MGLSINPQVQDLLVKAARLSKAQDITAKQIGINPWDIEYKVMKRSLVKMFGRAIINLLNKEQYLDELNFIMKNPSRIMELKDEI
jgi:hypothetical protein